MIIHYATVSGISVVSLFILGFIILKSDLVTKRIKRFFGLAILATVFVIAAEIATAYFESASVPLRVPHLIGNVLGFSISPVIPLLIGYAISPDKRGRDILFWVPSLINLVLSVLSARVPLIFGISGENVYFRGAFFWIYIIAYGAGIAFLFIETLRLVNHYQNKNRPVIFALFLFVVAGTSIQIIAPQLHVSWICISIAICLYYTYYCELYNQVDGLTGLLGRRAYENFVGRMKNIPGAAILIFDIDDFKSVNDKSGHQFGDRCLLEISACIKGAFFKIGTCFRIGGDEFCIISTSANEAVIQKACQKFLSDIESIRETEKLFPMVSIGCAYYNNEKGSIDEAILAADQEMYYYKHRRKKENMASSSASTDLKRKHKVNSLYSS